MINHLISSHLIETIGKRLFEEIRPIPAYIHPPLGIYTQI